MDEAFAQVLNMSLTGSAVILCVMAVRLLLKRAPKIFSYALWAVVLFRLLCPVSLPSPVSVLELLQPQVTETTGAASHVSYFPSEVVPAAPQQALIRASQNVPQPEAPVTAASKPSGGPLPALTVAGCIWLAGVAAMAAYSLIGYLRLRWRLVGAVPYRENICLADHMDSPFVMGILRPRIYLPSSLPVEEQRYIIAHEQHHIHRGDHIVKLLAYGALCLHWFNPLVWMAFILAGKDMEMSCDEAVIRKLGGYIRADYSASLLRLSTGRRIFAGTPLAFGEGDTKGRIRNMANWKKPKLWVGVVCSVVCIAVLVACAVNPERPAEPDEALAFPGTRWNSSPEEVFEKLGLDLAMPDQWDVKTDTIGEYLYIEVPELTAFGETALTSLFCFDNYLTETGSHFGLSGVRIIYPEDCDKDTIVANLRRQYGPEAEEYTLRSVDGMFGEINYKKEAGHFCWFSQQLVGDVLSEQGKQAYRALLGDVTDGGFEMCLAQPAARISWREDYYSAFEDRALAEDLIAENGHIARLTISGAKLTMMQQMFDTDIS